MKKLLFALVAFFVVAQIKAQCSVTISPASPTLCVGQSIVLTASGTTSYTWSANAGGVNTASVSVNPTVTTTYTVTAATGTCTTTGVITVTANPLPSVSVNTATICATKTATLIANGASTYSWTPSTGLSSTTGSSVNANPAITTNYTVTGTSSAGCTNTATTTVTVNPQPTVSVNSGTVCSTGTVALNAAGASSYTWSPGTGLNTTTGSSVIAGPTASTNYTVTGMSAQGCTNTAISAVTVATSPTVTVNSATLCVGSSTTLTASGATSYTWNPLTGLNTNVGASVVASPTTTTSYTVTGANGACTATAVATVTVMPLPVLTINQPTLCSSFSTVLTPTGAVSYTWTTGSTASSLTVSPSVTTSYTVFGTGSNGCTNFTVTTVTVFPSPTTTVNSQAICSGSTTLTAGGATTYTWSVNAGAVNTNTVQVTPSSTTVYTVTGGDPNTCTTTATATVYVNSSTVSITPPANTIFCTDNPYQFTGNANPGPITYWDWYATPSANVNIQNPNQSGAIITFYQSGTYTLTLVEYNSLGCKDSTLFPLTVMQTPTVIASPVAPIVCLGGPGTTLFSTVTPNFGPTTYTWSGTGFTQYANGDSANINPSSSGIYTYTLVGTQNGCVSQPTIITATVSPPPTPTLVAVQDTICAGNTATITSYGMPSTTSYTWTAPQTGGLGTNSGYYTWVTPVFSQQYDTTFVYQTNFYVPGCPPYPSYTTAVVVLATPIALPASDTLDNCNKTGDSLFVNSLPPISAGVTFTWTPSTGLSTTTGSAVAANPINQTWYYVTPYLKGCPGIKDSILVRVGDSTEAKIDAQYLITCTGKPDTLTGLPAINQLNTSYQYYWQPTIGPSAPVATPTPGIVVVSPIATTVYTLTVTGICVKQKKTELTIYVNNCPTPVPSFTMNTDTICINHCITYEDLTWQTGNNLPLFYSWQFNGATSITNAPGLSIYLPDSATYEATDSTTIPKIRVCYKINSSNNGYGTSYYGTFPVIEYVSHGPGTATVAAVNYVKVDPGPHANAGTNVTINLGDSVHLSGLGTTGNFSVTAYSWSPPDSVHCYGSAVSNGCSQPWVVPSQTTQYTLTVTDKNGCKDTATVTVHVDLVCYDPFVPTAFSPNGDGKNDILYVRSNCLQKFLFKVFDRWGEKVFESDAMNFGWDGEFRGIPVNTGAFVWTLEGFLSNGKEVKQKGSVTVIK